ncbi:MAG: hypothetical protein MJA27_14750 [Pseudanabaenales cyanobacterium]|nr:hypothetical protein [Pseudanabaenales cyanobacterium]
MKYTPKEIPEAINVTLVHPLINFGYLLAAVVGDISAILYSFCENLRRSMIGRISRLFIRAFGLTLSELLA